jgi:crotonobetainyl-CoA:carnitine CoA-transferase CaiB-like acyl-CoA transferase
MDYGCGLTSCAMVLAALVERERSGLGQYLEVPQTGAGLFAMSDVHGVAENLSETFPLDSAQLGHSPANALYRTADGWIVIACYCDREWQGVRRALAPHALASEVRWPRFAEVRAQRRDRSEAATALETALTQLTTGSALRRLRAENVPCTMPAACSVEEIINEPSMRSRGVIVTGDHFSAGEVTEVGHTVRFANANSWNLRPAPVVGQHSIAILQEIGRSEPEIARLIRSKVVNAPPTAASQLQVERRSDHG